MKNYTSIGDRISKFLDGYASALLIAAALVALVIASMYAKAKVRENLIKDGYVHVDARLENDVIVAELPSGQLVTINDRLNTLCVRTGFNIEEYDATGIHGWLNRRDIYLGKDTLVFTGDELFYRMHLFVQ